MNENKIKEGEIIIAFNNGNAYAFEYIYNKYYTHIFLIAAKFLKEENNAKDVRSQVFIKLWENIGKVKFENMPTLFGWLRTITSNTCIDYIRSINTRHKYEHDENIFKKVKIVRAEGEYDVLEEQEEFFECNDKEAAILNRLLYNIEKLPPNVKQVFKMRWQDDLLFREIAALLHLQLSTVKKRYARALKLLKQTTLFLFWL